jgi:hypothetical protein
MTLEATFISSAAGAISPENTSCGSTLTGGTAMPPIVPYNIQFLNRFQGCEHVYITKVMARELAEDTMMEMVARLGLEPYIKREHRHVTHRRV